MKITNQQVLDNLEEVKKYVDEAKNKVEEKTVGIEIKNRWTGNIIFQSTKTVFREAVLERLESGADLNGADLRGANLSGANLCYADLSDTNLRDANLSGANLRDANLSGANLRDANLSGANLRDADLNDADLNGAEMQNVKFYGRGGTKSLKKSQLPSFLGALGFVIEV